jgi:hypothetical protein
MPLTKKGTEIMRAMDKTYGDAKKAKEVFYASKNAGKIKGVEKKGARKR